MSFSNFLISAVWSAFTLILSNWLLKFVISFNNFSYSCWKSMAFWSNTPLKYYSCFLNYSSITFTGTNYFCCLIISLRALVKSFLVVDNSYLITLIAFSCWILLFCWDYLDYLCSLSTYVLSLLIYSFNCWDRFASNLSRLISMVS